MKFNIPENHQQIIRDRIINILKDYLSEEDQRSFTTTTNTKDDIDKNLIGILKGILR